MNGFEQFSADFLYIAVRIAMGFLSVSFLLITYQIIRGPTLPDRVVGLDMLVAVAIGLIAVIGIKSGYPLYVDIAVALGLVGFLATVAFARFILNRGRAADPVIMQEVKATQKKWEKSQ
ncbi:cation:proton antiporter [Flexibacterium corallicola]|uniref:cation:proton antiporter n=1 Tax=Flexibacterium corallicola TaxID=3037259 RepID=UPI00286ED5E2|nr:cation:proton antiporter [Pseudovibrio sp. M1P-2-3]